MPFRRVIRIAPGVRITLGRRGMPTSAGVSGINLSYVTSTIPRRRRRRSSGPVTWWQWLIVATSVLVMSAWWLGWL